MLKKIKAIVKKIRGNSNHNMIINLTIIFVGYLFFFNSKFIFNEKENLKNTAINTQLELGNRIITLAKWDYCPEDALMEVEFDIVNKDYDGNDVYEFDVIDNNERIYISEVILSSPTINVLRIYDVPEDFECMRIAVNVANNDDIVKYYADAALINRVDNIENYNDFNSYYVNKLNKYIDNYENNKQDVINRLDDVNKSITNQEQLITSLENQKKYTTADELNNINVQIADINKQLISLNNQSQELQDEISDIDKKIEDYKAIKMMYE